MWGVRSKRWRAEAALAVSSLWSCCSWSGGPSGSCPRCPFTKMPRRCPQRRPPRHPSGTEAPVEASVGSRANWPPLTICRASGGRGGGWRNRLGRRLRLGRRRWPHAAHAADALSSRRPLETADRRCRRAPYRPRRARRGFRMDRAGCLRPRGGERAAIGAARRTRRSRTAERRRFARRRRQRAAT